MTLHPLLTTADQYQLLPATKPLIAHITEKKLKYLIMILEGLYILQLLGKSTCRKMLFPPRRVLNIREILSAVAGTRLCRAKDNI